MTVAKEPRMRNGIQTKNFYRFNTEFGVIEIYVPEKLTKDDVLDIEAHFSIIVRQLKRKTEQ